MSVLRRSDLVAFMTDEDLPKIGLITTTRGTRKNHVVVYELGRRHEVHKSQLAKLEKKETIRR